MTFFKNDNAIIYTYQGEKCPGEVTDTWIQKMNEFLEAEVEDRMALATAKSSARCFLNEKEYTLSYLENMRKIYPRYQYFLQNYLRIMNQAKMEFESLLKSQNEEAIKFSR